MGIFNFLKKKKNAKTKKVFYDNGSIKEEFQVNADGVNHGSYKLYYPNQQLQVQVNWTNGIQNDGEVISYHDNGGKARQVILLNNKFTGNFFEWYSNGKNKKQGHYLDEKQIILKEWNENGELIEKDGNLNTKGSEDIKLPKWFKGIIYEHGEEVTNPFTGDGCELNNLELSVYDFIMGSKYIFEMDPKEVTEKNVEELQEALKWFRKTNPEAYKTLLD
jgi:hypothetical protein